jgi:H+/Cl- antiporter ClcA
VLLHLEHQLLTKLLNRNSKGRQVQQHWRLLLLLLLLFEGGLPWILCQVTFASHRLQRHSHSLSEQQRQRHCLLLLLPLLLPLLLLLLLLLQCTQGADRAC